MLLRVTLCVPLKRISPFLSQSTTLPPQVCINATKIVSSYHHALQFLLYNFVRGTENVSLRNMIWKGCSTFACYEQKRTLQWVAEWNIAYPSKIYFRFHSGFKDERLIPSFPIIGKDQVWDQLRNMNLHTSMVSWVPGLWGNWLIYLPDHSPSYLVSHSS